MQPGIKQIRIRVKKTEPSLGSLLTYLLGENRTGTENVEEQGIDDRDRKRQDAANQKTPARAALGGHNDIQIRKNHKSG